jgi:hypothetical protein
MINSNRLTIIVEDGTVITDTASYNHLDLSTCGIPSGVHALQWLDNSGEVEFNGVQHNQYVNNLPDWAVNCYNIAVNAG